MTDDNCALSITVNEAADGLVVVELAGELDLATTPELAARLEGLRGGSTTGIVVDVSQLAFIDSSGLKALVSAARAASGRLVVAAPSEHVEHVLDIVRLRDIVDVQPTVEAALRAASGTGTTDGEAA